MLSEDLGDAVVDAIGIGYVGKVGGDLGRPVWSREYVNLVVPLSLKMLNTSLKLVGMDQRRCATTTNLE